MSDDSIHTDRDVYTKLIVHNVLQAERLHFSWLKVSSCRTKLHKQQGLHARVECRIAWITAKG